MLFCCCAFTRVWIWNCQKNPVKELKLFGQMCQWFTYMPQVSQAFWQRHLSSKLHIVGFTYSSRVLQPKTSLSCTKNEVNEAVLGLTFSKPSLVICWELTAKRRLANKIDNLEGQVLNHVLLVYFIPRDLSWVVRLAFWFWHNWFDHDVRNRSWFFVSTRELEWCFGFTKLKRIQALHDFWSGAQFHFPPEARVNALHQTRKELF